MRTRMLIALLPLLLAGTINAYAHAFLDHANPRVGNTVATAPREVTLWFTQNLEAAFSTVTVTDFLANEWMRASPVSVAMSCGFHCGQSKLERTELPGMCFRSTPTKRKALSASA